MGIKETFKKQVIPIALDTTAMLEPWEVPSDEKILAI
jgi:hypothetical protein